MLVFLILIVSDLLAPVTLGFVPRDIGSQSAFVRVLLVGVIVGRLFSRLFGHGFLLVNVKKIQSFHDVMKGLYLCALHKQGDI